MAPGIRTTPKMLSLRFFEFEQGELIDDFQERFPEMKGISSNGFCFFSSLYWLKSQARLRRHHNGAINHFEEISFGIDAIKRQLDDRKFEKVLNGQAAYSARRVQLQSDYPDQIAEFRTKATHIEARARNHLTSILARLRETQGMMQVVGGTPSARTADALDIGNPQDYIARLERRRDALPVQAREKVEDAFAALQAKQFRRVGDVDLHLSKVETADAMKIHFIDGKLVTRHPGFAADIMGFLGRGGYFIIDFGCAERDEVLWTHAVGVRVTVNNLFRMAFFDPNLGVFSAGRRDVAEDLISELILGYIETDDNSCLYDRFAVLQVSLG
jgi:hypothetical protein